MNEHQRDVRLAGAVMGGNRHACALFRSPEEEYAVLLPFLREGIEQGDKFVRIVDPRAQAEHVQQLAADGIDTEGLQANGQLEVLPWEHAHLRGGSFNQNAMLSLLDETLQRTRARGYPQTRFWSNQEWALLDFQGAEDIVEYESRFNDIAARYLAPVVCVFDLTRFDATIMIDILRTHPMVVIGGQLHENPFYVPPEQFLEEIRTRKTAMSADTPG